MDLHEANKIRPNEYLKHLRVLDNSALVDIRLDTVTAVAEFWPFIGVLAISWAKYTPAHQVCTIMMV